jgi:peptidoglycan/LPS O-acetylase OafA/YrhL
MASGMSSRIRHYGFIDSLRAIAILGVIAVHTAQWVEPNSELLRRATAEGARGVQLFFVASAMTIFMSMKSRSALESAPLRNYFIRRFFRIAPLFYFGIVLWLFLAGFAPRYWAPNGIDGYTVLLTATFLHGFHPETITSLVPGGWSIAVEMMFYLVAPLMFRYIRDLPRAVAFFIAALLLNYVLTGAVVNFWLGFYLPEQQYLARSYGLLWFFAQLPLFALGMIAFHAMGNQFGPHRRLLGYSLLIMVAILWIAFLEARSYYNILPPHVFYGASFVLLALALAAHPTRLLVNPVMRKVGKISFSLYISHFVVLHIFDKAIFRDGFPIHGNAGFWAAWLLVTIISCAVSLFTYRYVERPGMDAGSYLIDRIESNNARKTI